MKASMICHVPLQRREREERHTHSVTVFWRDEIKLLHVCSFPVSCWFCAHISEHLLTSNWWENETPRLENDREVTSLKGGLVIMYAVVRTLCCIALQHKYVRVSHVLALGRHMTDDGNLNNTVAYRMIIAQKMTKNKFLYILSFLG